MHSTTSRRGLLKATPVAALAVAFPASAMSVEVAPNPEWEAAKAAFETAARRYRAACDAAATADLEETEWCRANPAPEKQIAYTEKGWTIDRGEMHVEMKPREGKYVLNPATLRHAPEELQGSPELAEYRADLGGWEARKKIVDHEHGWSAAHDEWDTSANNHIAAWKALVACPVSTLVHIAEKVEIARKDLCPEEDEIELMMESLNADLGRALGRV